MLMLGAAIYNTGKFKQYANNRYYPLENMQRSVDRLKEAESAGLINMQTMEFGDYQPILDPIYEWPNNTGRAWGNAVRIVMASFDRQGNTEPVSPDETTNIPPTKRERLNRAVRKCFNSPTPIPMFIDLKEKPIGANDPTEHDIELVWEYDQNAKPPDHPPTLLLLTMVCVHESNFPRGSTEKR